MQTPLKSNPFNSDDVDRSTLADAGPHDATIAELRNDLAALFDDVKRVVDARAARVQETADVGLDFARETIKSHPVASLAFATVVGAAAAILLVPASRPTSNLSKIRDWAPQLTRADVQEMIGSIQQTASRAAAGTPLLSVFERVVDSVSSIDPKSTLTPTLEKAGAWLNSMRGSITGK
jgi:ElaB/YqjD/DUF883 family membrane-anchored ribosome-binding protein